MNNRFCDCKRCVKLRKKGLVLGTRREGYFMNGVFGWNVVSDYVRHVKFSKGKKPSQ
jgi:hypothetical protein